MRCGITWTETTTYRSEVDLSTELITRNHHLRDLLLALYIEQTLPAATPATTQLTVVDIKALNQVDDTTPGR